jgi:hypothetical protein
VRKRALRVALGAFRRGLLSLLDLSTIEWRSSGCVRDGATPGFRHRIRQPETPALIANARSGASPDLLDALGALQLRFANNPTRSHR